MKVTIFGIGRMGTAIAYAMSRLGFDVTGVDSQPAEYRLRGLVDNYKFIHLKTKAGYRKILADKPDVVISSLPYHQTKVIADYCIKSGIRYCDLGGRVDVSQQINDLAKKEATKPVFTDLGLAPGWVNIVTESMIGHPVSKPDSIEMMVGGLPGVVSTNEWNNSNYNPLNYQITWSVDGLINEYRDDCVVLKDGEIKTVKGMDGLVHVNTLLGQLEAFYTSGGASHTIESMHRRGIKNCSYRTLRYPGHRDIVQWLINKIGLDDSVLQSVFTKGCERSDEMKDLVMVKVDVHQDDKCVSFEKIVHGDDKFSAMQKSTAFPISSVAALMARGKFDDRVSNHRDGDTKLSNVLGYSDVPYAAFSENLDRLLK